MLGGWNWSVIFIQHRRAYMGPMQDHQQAHSLSTCTPFVNKQQQLWTYLTLSIDYKLSKYFNWYISWKPLTDLIMFLEQLIKLGFNKALYQLKYWPSWSNDKIFIWILSKMVHDYIGALNIQLKSFNMPFQEAQEWRSKFEQTLDQKYGTTSQERSNTFGIFFFH